jgi:hypothetical protein
MVKEGLGKIPNKALLYTFKIYMEYVKNAEIEIIKRDWGKWNDYQKQFNPFNRFPCNILGDFVVNLN